MTPVAAFHWNIDPEIFQLGPLAPRWYGFMFALGFLFAYFLGVRMWRRERNNPDELSTLFVYIFLGTLIGARLGHCLFYDPAHYLRHPLEILMIWQGGLASHGGAIGVAVALWRYSRKTKRAFPWYFDRACVVAPLVGGMIRLGNFFNSEILGAASALPWAVVFERVDTKARHPAQLYEAAAYFAIFAILWCLFSRRAPRIPAGLMTGIAFVLIFSARFGIEFVKDVQEDFERSLPLKMGQLLSLPFIVVGAFLWARASGAAKSKV